MTHSFRPPSLILLLLLALTPVTQAKDAVIQCANLVYGGGNTSRCFSDEFLSAVQRKTSVATARRFKSVKLDSDELFTFPFVVMTGESNFHLSPKERENLKRYLTSGGFLLASAGCSSKDWDRSFRREIRRIFGDDKLPVVDAQHPVFKTVTDVKEIQLKSQADDRHLLGMQHDEKLVLIYSPHGLNDTAHTQGCCCCGGNEIRNALDINVNILVYALLH